jgi:leucyl-tRNA synthetase
LSEEGTIDGSIRDVPCPPDFERLYHQTVKKVGEDIEGLRFNTAVSQMMIFVNEAMKLEVRPRKQLEQFILLLAPFAPHLAEELWQRAGHGDSLAYEPWPSFDPAKTIEEKLEVVLQVNGKVRSKVEVARDTDEKRLEELARQDVNIRRYVDGKRVVRTVVVKNKLVNIVVVNP